MSSRLNPRDYDLGELRDAVREAPRGCDDGPADGPWDGRPDDLSAIEDLLHEDPTDGTGAEGTADAPSDETPTERLDTSDESVEEAGERSADGRVDRPGGDRSVGIRSDDGRGRRSDDGRGGRSGDPSGRGGGRSSTGRMRRNPARFARSASRDRTADGRPRRRGQPEDDERSGRSPSTAAGSPGHTAATSGASAARVDGFELLAAGSGAEFGRPYLERLPDSYRAQLEIFEWLEGLLGTCGWEATADALAYYESIGWLSEGTREDLEGFLEGLSAVEPPDPRPPAVDDHRESLRYVARLAHRVER